ncbi:MAG: alpha-ribazole phosphatase [Phycisphaeraceae bacterium]|nr:alpha-ribazole phosphatase [Phycisphaeraceae bacterium]
MARQLLLVRHADVGPQHQGRYLGRTDVPLSNHGMHEATELAAWLRSQRPAKLACSPMLRARQTADAIVRETGLTAERDDDLREVDFGLWEGKTFAEIADQWPGEVDQWAAFHPDFAFPGGERLDAFLLRVRSCANRLASDPTDRVLAVAHGGVIRAMICHLLGLDARHYLLFHIRHASCAVLDIHDGKGVLSGLNHPCPVSDPTRTRRG